jgi:inward rectifier potassium channel
MNAPQIPPHSRPYPRYVAPGARARPVIKGRDGSQWRDAYHAVLTATWPRFFAGVALYFGIINLIFAIIYRAIPHGLTGAQSLWDFFLFSIQTVTSASYTRVVPSSIAAEAVMTCEGFIGILNLALIAGIAFARFSRPFARVVFSNVAVIAPFDGVPTLMFRAANQRANLIYNASVTVSFARQVTSKEGHVMRRFDELKLLRDHTPLFSLSWTVMHRIDSSSPLSGCDTDALLGMEADIVIILSGTDETLADVLYARHSYTPDEIIMGHRFVDILTATETGRRVVDLRRFHDTEPLAITAHAETESGGSGTHSSVQRPSPLR